MNLNCIKVIIISCLEHDNFNPFDIYKRRIIECLIISSKAIKVIIMINQDWLIQIRIAQSINKTPQKPKDHN